MISRPVDNIGLLSRIVLQKVSPAALKLKSLRENMGYRFDLEMHRLNARELNRTQSPINLQTLQGIVGQILPQILSQIPGFQSGIVLVSIEQPDSTQDNSRNKLVRGLDDKLQRDITSHEKNIGKTDEELTAVIDLNKEDLTTLVGAFLFSPTKFKKNLAIEFTPEELFNFSNMLKCLAERKEFEKDRISVSWQTSRGFHLKKHRVPEVLLLISKEVLELRNSLVYRRDPSGEQSSVRVPIIYEDEPPVRIDVNKRRAG